MSAEAEQNLLGAISFSETDFTRKKAKRERLIRWMLLGMDSLDDLAAVADYRTSPL